MGDQKLKLITAEEYKAAVEAAKWMADNMSSLNVVYKRMARVLLALDGAWREVPTGFDVHGCITAPIYSKDEIAARNGLPVDEPKPCPECGGKRFVVIKVYDPKGKVFTSLRKPCPTCQGGR